MIRIRKPAAPPAILVGVGRRRRREHSREFTRNRRAFVDGDRAFDFDRRVYGDPSVKRALIAAQHGKCAFCESKIEHVTPGDVEHFRPKGEVRQHEAAPVERPGYYWLAYEWSNLYVACEVCNRRRKKDLFPLANPVRRARSHHQARRTLRESPLFLDPGVDDPEAFIGFRFEVPYAVHDDRRATTTISALELDRAPLCDRRYERLKLLDAILTIVLGSSHGRDASLVGKAALVLADASQDDAAYAAATRCLLRAHLGASVAMPISAADLTAIIESRAPDRR